MSPRSPDSLSEGEIVSGDEEKAINTTAQIAKDEMVNKSIRLPPTGSSSRSAQHSDMMSNGGTVRHPSDDHRTRPSLERSRSPHWIARSRSRSPHRTSASASGSKRGHDDDHYSRKGSSDPRRFKVHYEDRVHSRHTSHDPRRSYVDHDRPSSSNGQFPRGVDAGKTSVSKYTSLTEPKHQDQRKPLSAGQRKHERNGIDGYAGTGNSALDQRVDGTGTATSKKHESTPQTATQNRPAKLQTDQSELVGASRTSNDPTTLETTIDNEAAREQKDPEPTLSEAELIEQRRKRREAIRAKHKSSQPLLVQALEQNLTSAPSTPLQAASPESSDHHSPPSSLNSPSTPHQDSPPGSPATFTVSNDEELVDLRQTHAAEQDEGPSAADYDPNMDMQEDRLEHKIQELLDSTTGSPDKPGDEAAADAPQTVAGAKEFDMFANDADEDDEDDDMFAPGDKMGKSVTAAKQARALDQSLLDNWDYPDGHYRIILGELLDGRYAVQQQIGKGTFATVVRATDTRDGSLVAVKIACNNDTMYKAGQKEMDMLSILNQNDPEDKKHIIRQLRHFEHKGHLCLVFENLSADLREVLKKFGRNVGLNLKAIRSYAQQMFLALSHMKKCQILHADLKPDNILVSEKRSMLKICDLGTASLAADAEVTPYLVSRFYRAPEVILGIPFDYAIDMWSIGCTLFELYTGRILFAGADNNQMLRAIQECRSKFPLRMLKRATLVDKHFDAAGTFYSQERDRVTGKPTARPMNYNKTVPGKDLRARLSGNLKGMAVDEIKEHASFVDLMDKCLQLDPARRLTPNEALRHSFITHGGSMPQHGEKRSDPVRVAMNLPRKK